MEELAVAFQVVADLETGGDMQTLLDDGATHLGAGADGHVGEEDGFFDEGVLLDGDTRAQDALDDRAAADNAACRYDGVDGSSLVGVAVAGEEPCRGLVPVERANGPVVVVQVERRVFGTEVHVRLEEGVEGPHVAPVSLGTGLFAAHDVRVEVVHVHGVFLVQARDDVLAEVGSAALRALEELAYQELAREEVVAHAREAPSRVAGHFLGVLGLFLETDHSVVCIDLDDAEFGSFGNRHWDSGNGQEGRTGEVEINHLVDVHLVNVVAAENRHEVRAFVCNQVDVLENGVGRSLVPVIAGAHLCRNQVHVLVEARVQVPCGGDVLVQRIALELRQHLDLEDAGVDEVVQDKVNDAVGAAKVDGRLCAVAGEGLEAASLAARHDHAQDVLLVIPRIRPAHITSDKT